MAVKKNSNSRASYPSHAAGGKAPKYKIRRILIFVTYWFWPLLIVFFLYVARYVYPGFIAHDKPNSESQGYWRSKLPVDYYRNKAHYTIRAEEISENRNMALIRSVVVLNGEWPRESMVHLMEELEARYRKRTDFFKFAAPTHILIYLVDESGKPGDEKEHYIAHLSAYKDSPGQIDWNLSRTRGANSEGTYDETSLAAVERALHIFSDASPEISLLSGGENPRAYQVSIRDYSYSGDPKAYTERAARAVSKIIREMNRPCEGVFIALFKGNYYIKAESCLAAGILPDDEGSRGYASALIWNNTDKFEFFQ